MTHAPAPKRRVSQDADSSAEEADSSPPPPDGGWGWMVVFASFMIHIVTDGITYTFGVLFVELVDYFGASNAATSWIASILVGVTLCSGPISSSFVNKYGCRAVTIAGAILGFVCLILSMFATNVITLYFTIGLGTGFGFGLIYLPAIVSVTCYFEKYRSLATGIAVCGSGLGTFIFSPLTEYLITEYGWRGTLLLISSLVLQCTTFGALFRPVEEYYDKPSKRNSYLKESNVPPEAEMKLLTVDLPKNQNDDLSAVKSNGNPIQRPVSMGNFTMPRHNIMQPLESKSSEVNETARLALSQPALVGLSVSSHATESSKHNFGSQSGIMHRRDIFYRYSLQNIPLHGHRSTSSRSNMKLSHEKQPDERHLVIHSDYKKKKNQKLCGCIPCSDEARETLSEMLDFSILKDPIFILFIISNFCTSIGFNIPYVYIVAQAKSRNISQEDGSYLLSVIGIANTVGRVVLGYVSDKTWINRLFVYNISLTICGVATGLSALCYDFYSFAVYGTVFGFTAGAYVGLTSVVLVDLLGLDRLTNAFGLLLLFQGIASLIGPPIAGWLYDAHLSYDPGFIVAGVMIAFSGVMLFVIPPMQRHLEKNELSPQNKNVQLDYM